jgi:hypothetical protein
MSFDFDEPQETGRLYPADVDGHLLLIWAVEYIPHSPTKYSVEGKSSDVIVVDCVDLDVIDPSTGQPGLLERRCWWRPGRLIGALKSRIGGQRPMLAFMSRGVADKGQPPYILVSATTHDESVQRGQAWMAANPGFIPSMSQPSTPPPQAAPRSASVSAPPAARVPLQRAEEPRQIQETELERLARTARAGAARLPVPPARGFTDEPPF